MMEEALIWKDHQESSTITLHPHVLAAHSHTSAHVKKDQCVITTNARWNCAESMNIRDPGTFFYLLRGNCSYCLYPFHPPSESPIVPVVEKSLSLPVSGVLCFSRRALSFL